MPNRSVYKRTDGTWVNKRDDSDRASTLHSTQKEAEDTAREMLRREGGGELSTHGENGQIRSKDSIDSNDPRNIRDTEH